MERLQVQRKVQEIYMKLVEKGLLVRVNGNRPEEDVANAILAVALDFLES